MSSKRASTDWSSEHEVDRAHRVALGGPEPAQELRRGLVVEVEGEAAWPHQAPPEAAAAEKSAHVEEVAADAAAEARRGQKADVAREGAEVAYVVGQALELEGDRADRLGAGGAAELAALGGPLGRPKARASIAAQ